MVKVTKLSLSLLVFFSFTDNPHNSSSSDDFAFITDLFNRCSYFHGMRL